MKINGIQEAITFLCMTWTVRANPCTTFTELSFASKRDPTYEVDSVPVCDRYISPGWYRVKGKVLSTSPPPLGRCGSVYPIWLDGSNPVTAGNAVTLTAYRVGFANDREKDFTIQAKKCPNGDIVYDLKPPSVCSSAYCFEEADLNTCVNETVAAVEVVYHNITWEKKTLTRSVDYYDPVIHFVCQFTPLNDTSFFYTIEWFIENEWVKNYTVDASNISHLTFTTEDMIGINKYMGEKIQCTVGAKTAQDATACVYQSSTQFLVGFEILNTTLTIERGGSAQILLKQNIPYVPRTFPFLGGPAELYIQTKYKNTPSGACQTTGNNKKCEISVKGFHYRSRHNYTNPDAWDKIHTLGISSLDPLDYYIQEYRLVLRLGTPKIEDPFFSDVDFPDVNINIVDGSGSWKGERCSSYADPHMTSFDGYAYECQNNGCITGTTYKLYENARHRQEVQVRHGSCWGTPRCVCAVAARSGRDVFVVDFCDGREFINFPLCDDKSLQVFRDGDRTYRVFLATGTSVKISIYASRHWVSNNYTYFWYINVEIYPTVADVKSTSGLCGYLDNNQANDLRWKNGTESDISLYNYYYTHPNDFSKSWGLPTGSSEDLIAHDGGIYDNLQGLDNYVHKLCKCDNSGVICSYKQYQDCKTTNRGEALSCTLQTSNRRKRDLRKHQGHALRMNSVTRSERTKRQTTISQGDATVTCTRAFENSAHYDICLNNIPNFGNESLINCINDLVLTGNENLTQLHLETALSQCKEYILYNSTLQTEQSEIVYKIIILCTNNCSNRGICNEGNCTCDPGFGGSDCSFDLSAPPTITHISDDGLCDRTTEICDDIAIYGRYFVQNPKSACYMKRSEVNGSGVVSAGESYQAPLTQRTLFEAVCPLNYKTNDTWVTEFVFNVTNDGSQFTETFTVYVYQSACQIFHNDSGKIYFTLQEHYCFISGMCIPDGRKENNASCLQCDPTTDAFDWSNGCKTSTEMTTATSQEVPTSSAQSTVSQDGALTTSVPPISNTTTTPSVSPSISANSVSTETSTTSVSIETSTTASTATSTLRASIGTSTSDPVGISTTSVSTGTTATTNLPTGPSETSTTFLETSKTTIVTTPSTKAFTTTLLTPESTPGTILPTVKDTTEIQTSPSLTSKTTTQPSVSTYSATTMGPDKNKQRDSGADKNSQTYVVVGASIGTLVALVVIIAAGVMLKMKLTKRESVAAPNLSTEDFNIYPDRHTVPKDKFDPTTNLFSFSAPDEMYSRPPSATSMRKGPATVDLSRFYNSQQLDSLFASKK